MTSEKTANAFTQGFQFPNLPRLEWPKKAIEMSATVCAGALSFTAKQLQAQAEFMQSLAACNDLPELFKRQSDFWAAACGAYAGELPKIMQPSQASGSPQSSAG